MHADVTFFLACVKVAFLLQLPWFQSKLLVMSLIDRPERAKQLATAIASDLVVYHDKEIREGVETDNFFEVMHNLLEEGRSLFKQRVSPELGTQIYDRAVVNVILRGYAHVKSPLW